MRWRILTAAALMAFAATVVAAFAFAGDGSAPEPEFTATPTVRRLPTFPPPPTPTPRPTTWPAGLRPPFDAASSELLACGDANGDARLNSLDGERFARVDIPLESASVCEELRGTKADFYAHPPSSTFSCDGGAAPLLVVAIPSAGSMLGDAYEGESLGLLDIVNGLLARAGEAATPAAVEIAVPSVFGAAEYSQTYMEQFLAARIAARLDAMPCLRIALVGHSHGGVTVTSVTAALDGLYPGRLLGVAIDRSLYLYDRVATELPVETPLINAFQTNEGFHGEPIDAPNVTNIDGSLELAPVAPSDAGHGTIARVTHKTLDDAPNVQRQIVDEIIAWAEGGP